MSLEELSYNCPAFLQLFMQFVVVTLGPVSKPKYLYKDSAVNVGRPPALLLNSALNCHSLSVLWHCAHSVAHFLALRARQHFSSSFQSVE